MHPASAPKIATIAASRAENSRLMSTPAATRKCQAWPGQPKTPFHSTRDSTNASTPSSVSTQKTLAMLKLDAARSRDTGVGRAMADMLAIVSFTWMRPAPF
jgi:hypothetical protein